MPAETASVPAETASVPAETASVPAETTSVPAESAEVPVETASVPAETAEVPKEPEAEEPEEPQEVAPKEEETSEDHDPAASSSVHAPTLDYSLWEHAAYFPSFVPPLPQMEDHQHTDVPDTPVLYTEWCATPPVKEVEDQGCMTNDIEQRALRLQLGQYLRYWLTDSLGDSDYKVALSFAQGLEETSSVLRVQKILREAGEGVKPPEGWKITDTDYAVGANLLWRALSERLVSKPRPAGVGPPPKGTPKVAPSAPKSKPAPKAPPAQAKAVPSKAKPATKAMPKVPPGKSGLPVPAASGVAVPGVTAPNPKPGNQAKYQKMLEGFRQEAERKRRKIIEAGAEGANSAPSASSKAPTTPPKWSSQEWESWGSWKPDPEEEEEGSRLRQARAMVEEAKQRTRALFLKKNPGKAPPKPPPPPAV